MSKNILKLAGGLRGACLLLAILASGPSVVYAQTVPEPERETLLNGLRILYWRQPGNPNVLLKLRIHSGAAFDLVNRGGLMALLGDALFPDPATREYVADELGGRLDVTTTHDAIDITISGKAASLERMIDLLRSAVLTTQLDADSVTTLRNARIKLLSEKPPSAAEIADQAVAARLFGTFPYAHPPGGTSASVAKVERADLLLARERFLNADNASLSVVGGVEKPRLMRALRQLLGPWGKSDRTVPSTFRQPAAPVNRILALDNPGAATAEVRLAVRGLSRGDNDALAADLLAVIIRNRLQAAVPELTSISVRHESHLLPGMFVIGGTIATASSPKAVAAAQEITHKLAQTAPGPDEVERARILLTMELDKQFSQPDGLAKAWLDVDTFKSPRPGAMTTFIRSFSPTDLQRVAVRLFKDAAVATVVVGNYEQLKTAFADKVEPLAPAVPDAKVDPAPHAKKP